MLSYRVVLVDTEGTYDRPQQAFFQTLPQIDEWARKMLARAVDRDAYVVIYRSMESEVGRISKRNYDQSAAARVSPAGEEAG